MRIAAINTMAEGSTGTIMREIGEMARKQNYEYRSYYGNWKQKKVADKFSYRYGYMFENTVSYILYRISGIHHIGSIFGTLQLISKLKKYKPDIIHIHNIHLWVINAPMLFHYIKRNNIKVVWTLHDCWAFTGHCAHYAMIGCNKWKTGCHDCAQYKEYPYSKIDNSKLMWKLKQHWFSGVEEMVLVAPSQWLANQIALSYLKEYPLQVIYNGIDLQVFKPAVNRIKNDKEIVLLGVAFDWGIKKGLDVFNTLARSLPDYYKIIMVGTNDEIDKQLDNRIVSIHRTHDRQELAKLYSQADLFINPTREEVLGLVNVEALACGTPVITFNSGGSPECVDETCGIVIGNNDTETLVRTIIECENNQFNQAKCVERSKLFDKTYRYQEYLSLYERMMGGERKYSEE